METHSGERTIKKLLRLSAEKTPSHRRLCDLRDAAVSALKKTATNCFGNSVEILPNVIASRAPAPADKSGHCLSGGFWSFSASDGSVRLLISLDARGVQSAASAYLDHNWRENGRSQIEENRISEIDKRLAQIFVSEFVDVLQNMMDTEPATADFERLTASYLEESAAIGLLSRKKFGFASFSLVTDDQDSLAAIGLYSDIEAIIGDYDMSTSESTADWTMQIRNAVMTTPVRLSALLACKEVSISSLQRFKTGDVVALEQAALDEVALTRECGDWQPIMSGALVSNGETRALTRVNLNLR